MEQFDVTNADLERGNERENEAFFRITVSELVPLTKHRTLRDLEALGGVTQLARRLRVDLQRGIDPESVVARQQYFGANLLKYAPPPSFLRLVFAAWKDVTLVLLTGAALISLVLGLALPSERTRYGYLDGCAILVVVVLVVCLDATIALQRERRFRSLNAVKDAFPVRILRGGEVRLVDAPGVLVGDLIKLSAGDKVPADGILLQGTDFACDESTLTGESVPVSKTGAFDRPAAAAAAAAAAASNAAKTTATIQLHADGDDVSPAPPSVHEEADIFVLSGTIVTSGFGTMLTVAVGMNSVWGQLLTSLRPTPPQTPLQVRLNRLARSIGYIGLGLAFLVFGVLFIRWLVDSIRSGSWPIMKLTESITAAIAIAVVAIPEGLPLAVVLSLAFAMRQMMKENILVRRLEACETMGSATQLNIDKTGTMTWNQLRVTEAALPAGSLSDLLQRRTISPIYLRLLASCIAINSQADLRDQQNGTVKYIGNRTECALLELLHRMGISYRELRAASSLRRVYLFNSTRKQMCSIEQLAPDGRLERLHVKGAPDQLLERCVLEMNCRTGALTRMSWSKRNAYRSAMEAFAEQGLRMLLVAFWDQQQPAETGNLPGVNEPPETELILLGIFGMSDPLRPDTAASVRALQQAGVFVRMVTGDSVQTATQIAQAAELLEPGSSPVQLVWDAAAFRQLPRAVQQNVSMRMRVLARATPADKLELVQLFRALEQVVAVTGDGSNDAPALREADIGFGMGVSGTELAKEAADVVLLDDRLGSIVAAVLWGRNVLENIRKFLQFQLTVNIVAVTLDLFSACAGMTLPLSTVPLLWVNVVMDSFGALALATEAPRSALMQQPPQGRNAPLITSAMVRNMLGIALYQLAVMITLLFVTVPLFHIPCYAVSTSSDPCGGQTLQRNGFIFNTFVFLQLVSELNSRRIAERHVFEGIGRARLFLCIVFGSAVIQVVLVEVLGRTAVGQSVGIVNLSGAQWGAGLLIAGLELPIGFLTRLCPVSWVHQPGRLWQALCHQLMQRNLRRYQAGTNYRLGDAPMGNEPQSTAAPADSGVAQITAALPTISNAQDDAHGSSSGSSRMGTSAATSVQLKDRCAQSRRRFRVFCHAAVALQRMDLCACTRESARIQQAIYGQSSLWSESSKRNLRSRLWAVVGMLRLLRVSVPSPYEAERTALTSELLGAQLKMNPVALHSKQS